MKPSPGQVTQLLGSVSCGDQKALSELLAVVYSELKTLAAAKMRMERPDHTLQPTALVHEAFMRLVGQENLNWNSRTHFFGAAAEVMRRVLVDHARQRKSEKRGGGRPSASLDEALVVFETRSADLLELDSALKRLAELDPRQSRIVELRFFGGLSTAQVAKVVEVSERTVERDWRLARAWLMDDLGGRESDGESARRT
ncbi:MAG: sigma-70 family RNA polymerase sigma factor [Planctomycetes bacterium]|nr:sigma-70 family RNA polymerase sigma factor [Planctomycetota bacterium]